MIGPVTPIRTGEGGCVSSSITTGVQTVMDLEYVTVKGRPPYLSREFTAVMITALYIAPDANANSAIGLLHHGISSQLTKHPDAVHIVAGDFNHVDLKTVLPKFHQHVKCATRGADKLTDWIKSTRTSNRATGLNHCHTWASLTICHCF